MALRSKHESISPFFDVADVAAAIEFYTESLGFELAWKWGEPPTQANVCRDSISISFSAKPLERTVGNIYVHVSGVDGYFTELENRGLKIGAIADRDYGMRDFVVIDPWGNRLVFGEPSPV